MNTLLPSARNFLEGVSDEELFNWFKEGIKRYYDAKTAAGNKAIHLACLHGAFDYMDLSLGQSQHRTTLVEEFESIFEELSDNGKKKLQTVLGRSMIDFIQDEEFIEKKEAGEIIKDIIILALDFKYEGMADILAELLPQIKDTQLKSIIYIEAVFFMEEATDPSSTRRLLQVYLDNPEIPNNISLKLITAVVQYHVHQAMADFGKLDDSQAGSQ